MRLVLGSMGVFAALCFASPLSAQTSSCAKESETKSGNGVIAIQPVVTNETKKLVRYYWLDGAGKRTGGGTLKPGEGHTLGTYVSHQFVFTDSVDGSCLAISDFPRTGNYGLVASIHPVTKASTYSIKVNVGIDAGGKDRPK